MPRLYCKDYERKQFDIPVRERDGSITTRTVEVGLSMEEIARSMGPDAIRNKTGRCVEIGGLVVVKRIK